MSRIDTIADENSIALKEWAIVCEAIRLSRQQLLFRTGGIEESERGFEPKHKEFWLYPTRFHQTSELVTAEFAEEAQHSSGLPENKGTIPLQVYCRVTDVYFVDSLAQLTALSSFHVLAEEVLRQRFEYRSLGLFVLLIRPCLLPDPKMILHHTRYDGCKSWVDLNEEIPTKDLELALSDEKFNECRQAIRKLLGEKEG